MAPKERVVKALTPLFSDSSTVCSSCRRCIALQHQQRRQIQTRSYASTAPAIQDPSPTPSPPLQFTSSKSTPTDTSTVIKPAYSLQAGVVLSRPPTLTRSLHPFEKAFYLYQKRLNERLAIPFSRYFYIKKGTPADRDWKRKMKTRLTAAKEIGVYMGYGKEAWADEVLVGDQLGEPEVQRETLVRDMLDVVVEDVSLASVGGSVEEETEKSARQIAAEKLEADYAAAQRKKTEVEMPSPRITPADERGDEKSLDRLGERTLYLVVKSGRSWMFPSSKVVGRENLHQTVERLIVQAAGSNMNTWLVGRVPIGHFARTYQNPVDDPERGTKELGEKVFFLKGRIMAGQANIAGNVLGFEDFKWLAKDEIKAHVHSKYWSQIEDMLAER